MTGVYVGNFASDYETLAFKEPESIEGVAILGMGRTTVSNRVSYMYNLHGPRFDSARSFDLAKPITDVWTTVVTAANRATCETDFILKDGIIYIVSSPIWS
ncbi:Beta-ketoacyl synthase [Penicillium roqueforti FM164]|uniref:Beta-ketoacyl synthase n=1 Tax=Penicillium roqueforti (strain FM164) TaxID=1365484 RepID=W6PZE6_PENRF|nr:Beta-ketoacyl synthase [Penicillium roqueforti FM164]